MYSLALRGEQRSSGEILVSAVEEGLVPGENPLQLLLHQATTNLRTSVHRLGSASTRWGLGQLSKIRHQKEQGQHCTPLGALGQSAGLMFASASIALGELAAAVPPRRGGSATLAIDRASAKSPYLPSTTTTTLRDQFDRMDTNGNGELDMRELQAACVKLGLPSSDEYIHQVMRQYGEPSARTITFREFQGYIRKQEKRLQRAFLQLDLDGDGSITAAEALKSMRALGISAKEKDAMQMISLLDTHASGVVTFEEFRAYLCLLPAAHLRENPTWNWMGSAVDRVVMAPRSQPAKQLFAGAVSGAVGKTCTAPLDRARTIMQAEVRRAGQGSMNLGEALSTIWRTEGPAGLFRGNLVSVLKIIPSSGLQFCVFESSKDWLMLRSSRQCGDLSNAERLAAGSAAGLVSTLICYPLDTIKTQMSVQGGYKGSFLEVVRRISRDQGRAAFYKGLAPTLVTDIIGNGLGFTLYDSMNAAFKKHFGRRPKPYEKGLVGGTSACICMTATMPLEVVMTRMRIQGSPGNPVLYRNMVDCLVKISRREGVSSLWKGSAATYMKVFPQLGIVYFMFELLARELAIGGIDRYR